MQLHRLKVLVADDNPYARTVLRTLLGAYGIRDVIDATDGAEAVDLIALNNPDVVILDWAMPIFTGLEVTRWVRTNQDAPNPFCPIILVTAYSSQKHVLEALSAGVHGFVRKPVSAAQLYQHLLWPILRPRAFVRDGEYFGPPHSALGHDMARETKQGDPIRSLAQRPLTAQR
ncbi:MAG: response regulator [Pseudomonadota bacterium]